MKSSKAGAIGGAPGMGMNLMAAILQPDDAFLCALSAPSGLHRCRGPGGIAGQRGHEPGTVQELSLGPGPESRANASYYE